MINSCANSFKEYFELTTSFCGSTGSSEGGASLAEASNDDSTKHRDSATTFSVNVAIETPVSKERVEEATSAKASAKDKPRSAEVEGGKEGQPPDEAPSVAEPATAKVDADSSKISKSGNDTLKGTASEGGVAANGTGVGEIDRDAMESAKGSAGIAAERTKATEQFGTDMMQGEVAGTCSASSTRVDQ